MHKLTTGMVINTALTITIGLMCIIGGLVNRTCEQETCRFWESGKWSVHAVREFAGIQTDADIATPRERALFSAVTMLNDVGATFARLAVREWRLVMIVGVCLLYLGCRQLWSIMKLKKLIAEQRPEPYR